MHKTLESIFDLTGKTAIVTGGARGIGSGIVIRLAQAGANVIACDIDGPGLEKAVAQYRANGLEVTGAQGDISVEADCIKTVQKAVETYGSVDILVNNASFFPTIPLVLATQEEWDKVFAINCRGTFLMTREAAKVMIEQNETAPGCGGSIVMISSTGAWRTNRVGMSTYHSTKGAMISFKNHLAGELAPYGIRVNAILPGAINSMRTDENGEYQPMPIAIEKVPLQRMGVPYDIGNAVLFLTSPAGAYISGVDIPVDGGLTKVPTFGYPEEQKIIREYSAKSEVR